MGSVTVSPRDVLCTCHRGQVVGAFAECHMQIQGISAANGYTLVSVNQITTPNYFFKRNAVPSAAPAVGIAVVLFRSHLCLQSMASGPNKYLQKAVQVDKMG